MDSFGEPLCVTTDAGNRYRDEQKGIIMALEKNRLAVLASSAMLALSLVACSSGSTETTAADTPAEEEETVVSTEPAVETRTVYVVTEKSLHYNGGTLYYDDFKFDEKGRLIGEHEIWDGSGHAKWDNTITFEYTDEGLLAKRTEHITGDWTYVDSKHHEFEPYDLISTFDEHGNLVKVESTGEEDADGNMYQGYGPGTYKNTYDEKGMLTETEYYTSEDDDTPLVWKYTYDQDGVLSTRWESSSTKDEGYTTTYVYDENGNLISEDTTAPDGDTTSTTYTYEAMSVEVEVES